jgi:NAD(P)H-dependent FMN reductase
MDLLGRDSRMVKIAVVVGSTRPGRNGEAVARWVHELAGRRTDARFELVDIATYDLPLLDEPVPPSMGRYGKEHTRRWAAKVAEFDGYVFVTPEYNHGPSAALKNAAGFVGYGSVGGTRAVEQLRLIAAELQMATVRSQVALSLFTDFENLSTFRPGGQHEMALTTMLDQLISWSQAMKSLRESSRMAPAYQS